MDRHDNDDNDADTTGGWIIVRSEFQFRRGQKQIAIVVAEVVTRAFLDHIFYEGEFKRTSGKVYLGATARAKSIAKMATTAVNSKPFYDADCSQVQPEEVDTELMERMKASLKVNPTNNTNRPSSSNSQWINRHKIFQLSILM